MKKYFVAAVVALALFAATAFASTLWVDGGVLQAGQDANLTVTNGAVVTWGTQTVGNGNFAANKMTVTFDPTTWVDGQWAYVAVFSDTGDSGRNQTGFAIAQIADGKVVLDVNESSPDADVSRINAVSVLVKNSDDSGVGGWRSGLFDPLP